MKSYEFITEKKRKRRPRWAAYGPGPYGGYGYAVGYSGDGGGSSGSDGGGGVGEASYPGNLGMMELAKFFQTADDAKKKLFQELLQKGKKGLAWKLVQDTVGVKLQGKEFEEDVVTELKITDRDVQRIIKDRLAIDAESGIDAMKLAIDKMISMPPSSYVKSLAAQLMMLYKQAKMSIGGEYYKKLNKLSENFADGKVKGKSRPGRVKRAGASCNGSVTDLRAKAKNASGEKAKMYHWCANMKSGLNK